MKKKYQFKINKEKWEALVKLRGWKYPVAAVAKRAGFSKSYVSQLVNGELAVSHDFMLEYIDLTGNDRTTPEGWESLFVITKNPQVAKGNTRDNFAKFCGRKSYVQYSAEGEMRIKDRAQNLDRLKDPAPIAALEYYEDATPKRIQTMRRYKR